MGKKESVPNRRYTEEFKTEAVRLAVSTGGNAAAKRLGIPQSTMTNWVRRHRDGASPAVADAVVAVKRPVSELEAENARLRRELASAKLDLEIVKKAAAYFAKESR
jgi:transposase